MTERSDELIVSTSKDNFYNRTQIEVEDQQGTDVFTFRYYDEGYFALDWKVRTIDVENFFRRAQKLVDAVKTVPTVRPYYGKHNIGARIWLGEEERAEEREEPFTSLSDLGVDAAKVTCGGLYTPYGDIIFDASGEEISISLLSHLDAPGYLTDFVMANSDGQLPGAFVYELISRAGKMNSSSDIARKIADAA